MAILIDGYNLLYEMGLVRRRSGPGGLEKARRALLGLLAGSLSEEEARRTTVVFDASDAPPGSAGQFEYSGLTVRFAAGHEDADALIEQLIAADSAPRQLTVVSSDRRLKRAARRRRAAAVNSEQFLDDLKRRRRAKKASEQRQPVKKSLRLSEADTEFWLREFRDLAEDEGLDELFPFSDES